MPRCTSTMKFASYDEPTAEWSSEPEVSDTTVEATIRIVRPCADCGEEMAETELDLSDEFDPCDPDTDTGECAYVLDYDDPEPYEDSGPTTRTLKSGAVRTIPPRFVKSYIGASADVRVKCETHDAWEGVTLTLGDRCQASHFEVLVD